MAARDFSNGVAQARYKLEYLRTDDAFYLLQVAQARYKLEYLRTDDAFYLLQGPRRAPPCTATRCAL